MLNKSKKMMQRIRSLMNKQKMERMKKVNQRMEENKTTY